MFSLTEDSETNVLSIPGISRIRWWRLSLEPSTGKHPQSLLAKLFQRLQSTSVGYWCFEIGKEGGVYVEEREQQDESITSPVYLWAFELGASTASDDSSSPLPSWIPLDLLREEEKGSWSAATFSERTLSASYPPLTSSASSIFSTIIPHPHVQFQEALACHLERGMNQEGFIRIGSAFFSPTQRITLAFEAQLTPDHLNVHLILLDQLYLEPLTSSSGQSEEDKINVLLSPSGRLGTLVQSSGIPPHPSKDELFILMGVDQGNENGPMSVIRLSDHQPNFSYPTFLLFRIPPINTPLTGAPGPLEEGEHSRMTAKRILTQCMTYEPSMVPADVMPPPMPVTLSFSWSGQAMDRVDLEVKDKVNPSTSGMDEGSRDPQRWPKSFLQATLADHGDLEKTGEGPEVDMMDTEEEAEKKQIPGTPRLNAPPLSLASPYSTVNQGSGKGAQGAPPFSPQHRVMATDAPLSRNSSLQDHHPSPSSYHLEVSNMHSGHLPGHPSAVSTPKPTSPFSSTPSSAVGSPAGAHHPQAHRHPSLGQVPGQETYTSHDDSVNNYGSGEGGSSVFEGSKGQSSNFFGQNNNGDDVGMDGEEITEDDFDFFGSEDIGTSFPESGMENVADKKPDQASLENRETAIMAPEDMGMRSPPGSMVNGSKLALTGNMEEVNGDSPITTSGIVGVSEMERRNGELKVTSSPLSESAGHPLLFAPTSTLPDLSLERTALGDKALMDTGKGRPIYRIMAVESGEAPGSQPLPESSRPIEFLDSSYRIQEELYIPGKGRFAFSAIASSDDLLDRSSTYIGTNYKKRSGNLLDDTLEKLERDGSKRPHRILNQGEEEDRVTEEDDSEDDNTDEEDLSLPVPSWMARQNQHAQGKAPMNDHETRQDQSLPWLSLLAVGPVDKDKETEDPNDVSSYPLSDTYVDQHALSLDWGRNCSFTLPFSRQSGRLATILQCLTYPGGVLSRLSPKQGWSPQNLTFRGLLDQVEVQSASYKYGNRYMIKAKQPPPPPALEDLGKDPIELEMNHDQSGISLSATVLPFWESLGLEPWSGPKHIVASSLLFPVFHEGPHAQTNEEALTQGQEMLRGIQSMYEMCHLGSHRPVRGPHKGVILVSMISDPLSVDKLSSALESEVARLMSCKIEAPKPEANEEGKPAWMENAHYRVLYIQLPSRAMGSLGPRQMDNLCRAFERARKAAYAQNPITHDRLILQIIPSMISPSSISQTLDVRRRWRDVAMIVYQRGDIGLPYPQPNNQLRRRWYSAPLAILQPKNPMGGRRLSVLPSLFNTKTMKGKEQYSMMDGASEDENPRDLHLTYALLPSTGEVAVVWVDPTGCLINWRLLKLADVKSEEEVKQKGDRSEDTGDKMDTEESFEVQEEDGEVERENPVEGAEVDQAKGGGEEEDGVTGLEGATEAQVTTRKGVKGAERGSRQSSKMVECVWRATEEVVYEWWADMGLSAKQDDRGGKKRAEPSYTLYVTRAGSSFISHDELCAWQRLTQGSREKGKSGGTDLVFIYFSPSPSHFLPSHGAGMTHAWISRWPRIQALYSSTQRSMRTSSNAGVNDPSKGSGVKVHTESGNPTLVSSPLQWVEGKTIGGFGEWESEGHMSLFLPGAVNFNGSPPRPIPVDQGDTWILPLATGTLFWDRGSLDLGPRPGAQTDAKGGAFSCEVHLLASPISAGRDREIGKGKDGASITLRRAIGQLRHLAYLPVPGIPVVHGGIPWNPVHLAILNRIVACRRLD